MQFTGESVERGVAHAAGFHQSAVLLFGEPTTEPFALLIRQHPCLDVLTARPSRLRGEWAVNELRGQHTGELVYLHCYSSNS